MSSQADRHSATRGGIAALFGSQVVRFGIVSVIGMVIDVATAWLLSTLAGLPLTLAAAAGFGAAAGLNYVLHARWTFAGATDGLSPERGGLYLLTLGATLATRLAVVALLQAIVPDGPFKPLLALVPAIGASFVVNFLLNKLLVFRGPATDPADEAPQLKASHQALRLPAKPAPFPGEMMNSVPDYKVIRWHGRRSSACVIIPVINEGERIGRLLRRIHAIDIPDQADVIIVDGGSTDGSLEADLLDGTRVAGLIVKRGPGKLSAQLRCAYDFVLREGYDEIITIDGNDKDDPDPIPDFIAAIRGGYDFVQASRFLPGGIEENTPTKRRFAVRYIHAPALSLASGFDWTDTTQGFRAYSRRLLTDKRIDIFRDEFDRYELLAYLNYRAPRLGYRCIELPTTRRYPANEAVPTKIDFRNEVGLLLVLAKTCLGGFDAAPPTRPALPRSGLGENISPGKQLVIRAGYALLFAAALVTALITSFHLPLDAPWTDLFQEGEYLSPRLYFDGAAARPLLIHGQLDYLPAQFAGWLCPGSELVCTRAINSGLTALAGLIFFFCAFAAVDRGRSRVLAGAGALAILFAINRTRTTLIDLHQGAPAIRDLGLLTAILFLILGARQRGRAGIALPFLGGLAAGFSALFTYNRGLTGLVAVGCYIVVSVVVGGNWKKGAAAAIGLVVGLALLVLPDPGMARAHFANVAYWGQHHDIWAYDGTSLRQFVRPVLFYLLATPLLLGGLWLGWRSWHRQSRTESLPILAVLGAVCALVLQQSTQRYDGAHLSFAVPWLFLLGLWMTNLLPAPVRGFAMRPAIAAGYPLLLVLISGSLVHMMTGASAYNLKLLTGHLPSDTDLVAPDVRAVAALLRRSDPACTYVLNNAAGLYELSSRRPCSTVMVPVYATEEAETRLIADLARTRPPIIVSRSPDWFNTIDSRSLERRTPRLARWIKANYPSTFKIGTYELRSQTLNLIVSSTATNQPAFPGK